MTDLLWADDLSPIFAEPDPYRRVSLLADALRLNALSAIMKAGSGHIGTCFSSAEIVAHCVVHGIPLISSKGHDAPLLYAAAAADGRIPSAALRTLRTPGGLPGHPEPGKGGQIAATGSLGVGLSKAMGYLRAHPEIPHLVVLVGDGETQEGQVSEALRTYERRMTVVLDRNGYGSDDRIPALHGFACPEWGRCDINGHRAEDLEFGILPGDLCVAMTTKGYRAQHIITNPSRMHSGAPTEEEYEKITQGLAWFLRDLTLTHEPWDDVRLNLPDPLIGITYSNTIVSAAEHDPRVMALDADLVKDCGLREFRRRYPDRYIECGISEQHMVSLAGGLALGGKVPFVHSFAGFLVRRAADQIWQNCIDRSHVIYVGSLTTLPRDGRGPGPSHYETGDVEIMRAFGIPILQPTTPEGVREAVRQALSGIDGPSYIRLP